MRFLFIMDSPDTVIADEDTSFGLMHEAQGRGHRIDHAAIHDLVLEPASLLRVRARPAQCEPEQVPPLQLGEVEMVDVARYDAVFIRKDPPFDANYLWATLLLEHVRDETLLINDPRGLRDANEKLYAMFFPYFAPASLVSSDRETIRAFTKGEGGKSVIKPIDGRGGEGVFALDLADANFNAIVETVTAFGTRMTMVQRYIPEVVEGDKRILVLNGKPLGAILRVPQKGDLRSNIHVGGKVVAATLNDNDRAIVARVAPRLQADGLHFVGLDVIGDRLTEVNVTSPTGIRQMSRLNGENIEAKVVDWVEGRVESTS